MHAAEPYGIIISSGLPPQCPLLAIRRTDPQEVCDLQALVKRRPKAAITR